MYICGTEMKLLPMLLDASIKRKNLRECVAGEMMVGEKEEVKDKAGRGLSTRFGRHRLWANESCLFSACKCRTSHHRRARIEVIITTTSTPTRTSTSTWILAPTSYISAVKLASLFSLASGIYSFYFL